MRIRKFLLSLVFVVSALGAFAQGGYVPGVNHDFISFEYDGFDVYAHSESGTCSVSPLDENVSGHVIYPSTVQYTDKEGKTHTFTVREVHGWHRPNLKSITIPSSVTVIPEYAFADCGLTSIEIPASVEVVGRYAFVNCAELTSATIHAKNIYNDVFKDCSKLATVTLGNTVEHISDFVFSQCPMLTSISIPSSVTAIGYDAFGAYLKDVTVNWPTPLPLSLDNGRNGVRNGAFDYRSSGSKYSATLHVPAGTEALYRVADVWRKFYEPELSVLPISLEFSAAGGKKTFQITSNRDWYVDGAYSWLTVSSADFSIYTQGRNDATITVEVEPNTESEQRTREITVNITNQAYDASPISQSVTVTQAAGAIELEVTPSLFNFPSEGGEATISVNSNAGWNVSLVSSNPEYWSWIDSYGYTKGGYNGEVTIKANANTTSSERTATYIINGTGGVAKTITVKQAAAITPFLSVLPSSLEFDKDMLTPKTVKITSNVNWTATTTETWLTISSTSGSADATISVTATANSSTTSRTGNITIKGGDITQTVTVTQEAASNNTDPTEVLPSSISLNESSITLATGGQKQLTATILPDNTTDKSVKWSSANTDIATVDENGLVSAVSEGSTTITIESLKNGIKTTCTVNVIKEQAIIVEPSEPVNNQGIIEISLNILTDQTFTVSFAITLPEGFSLDQHATSLVEDLISDYTLVITPNGNNSWKFEIRPKSLRNATETIYRDIVRIVYIVEESLKSGQYNTAVKDVKLQFNDGTTILEDEIIIPVTINSSVGNALVESDVHVYCQQGALYINTPYAEQIDLFSINGTLLYQADKSIGETTYKINHLPQGVLIVKGSSGWVKKVVK